MYGPDGKISRDELIDILTYYTHHGAGEEGHMFIDGALLAFIDDEEITELFNNISNMWYV